VMAAPIVGVNLILTLRWKCAEESAQSFPRALRGLSARGSRPRHPIPR
jgi:hypothetical protein